MESKFSLSLILLLFLVCFSDSRILVFSLSRYEENVAAESDWIADFSWVDQYLSPIVFWWSNWSSAETKYSASPEIDWITFFNCQIGYPQVATFSYKVVLSETVP